MPAAGLYKGYEYLILTETQVDAIDAAAPAPGGNAISRVIDAAASIVDGEIQDDAVGTDAIQDGSITFDKLDPQILQYAEISLSKANILAMNATPIEVIAAPGAGLAIEFLSAVIVHDFAGAGYTGGGDITFKYASAATVSSTVSAANSFGASSDKATQCVALDTAGGVAMSANTALQITNASGAFTDPGTATGIGRLKIAYRLHRVLI